MKLFIAYLTFLLSIVLVSADETKLKPFLPIDEDGKKGVSAFQVQWYSKHLKIMKEVSLQPLSKDPDAEAYRFTLLPTRGDPRSLRLSKVKGEFVAHYSRLDGDGGYDPGKLVESVSKPVERKELDEFLKLFGAVKFFKQSSEDENRGLDGSEWILEAVSGGKYHIVVRWTPTAYDPEKRGTIAFVKACEWLMAQAPTKGEQGGADQPATAPESKPEGKEKPQPESEGRSQYRVAELKRSPQEMMRDIFLLPTHITAEYGVYALIGFSFLFISLAGFVASILIKRKQAGSSLYILSTGVILISPWILILIMGDRLEIFYFFSPLSFVFGMILFFLGLFRKVDMLLFSLPLASSVGYWGIAIFGEIIAQI